MCELSLSGSHFTPSIWKSTVSRSSKQRVSVRYGNLTRCCMLFSSLDEWTSGAYSLVWLAFLVCFLLRYNQITNNTTSHHHHYSSKYPTPTWHTPFVLSIVLISMMKKRSKRGKLRIFFYNISSRGGKVYFCLWLVHCGSGWHFVYMHSLPRLLFNSISVWTDGRKPWKWAVCVWTGDWYLPCFTWQSVVRDGIWILYHCRSTRPNGRW